MYRDVFPGKDHLAVICSGSRVREEEIDAQILARTLGDQYDLVGAAAADMWTDKHATMTRPERSGISRFELEREILDRIFRLCPPEHS
jgi:hypothetical protein